MTTPFNKAASHHAEHIYKRGKFKGDAPAERRSKSHLRVIKQSDTQYAVRMYETDILKVHADGSATIDCGGYVDRITTVMNLNNALNKFVSYGIHVRRKCAIMSHPQTVLCFYFDGTWRKYRYYDGIKLAIDPATDTRRIVSPLRPLLMRRINKAKVAALNADMAQSGFKDAFKIMHAVSEPMAVGQLYPRRVRVELAVSDAEHADQWPMIIAEHAHYTSFDFSLRQRVTHKRTAADTWALIMREAKRGMYDVLESDVFFK